ncbi:glycoside hydrolase family 10 [Fibrella aestuarina BUZ 2]|uniref:Beta-xylanase n=1 Tax=Fibrella aestuarina BUZ 2 TaxID=1166018 RepID=I0K8D6_9BACT|nr:endo-1,4-beta-xylanase [Fibrella aestuarina]CCH00389.1 glycoside hydrolase family 10 [Fibrella aestuarina BUZ 2]
MHPIALHDPAPGLTVRLRLQLTATCVLLTSLTTSLLAQPTGKRIDEQAAAARVGHDSLGAERTRIEAEYLAKATANIEKYRKGDARLSFVDATGKPVRNVLVTVNQVSQDFLFGNLVFELGGFAPKEPYKVDLFKERFKALFNMAVLPFYWGRYEPTPGMPEWQRNQDALDWCLANGITTKGHTLGWTSPSGTPTWLLQLSPEVATDVYKARIMNNVLGFKGKINIWDVVNEPVNTVPWEVALKDTANTNDFRYNVNNVPVEAITPWVEQSFKWAYAANPDGNYILNEYFTLAIPKVRERFYQLLKALKSRNAPISGIGIQGHEPREMWFSPVEVYKTFDLYQEFGLPIHITELIPQSSGKPIKGWRTGTWTEEAQAEFARQFYTLAYGHPAIASINWWGLSDRSIWLKGGGLLDEAYNPKPVYNVLMKLIKDEWMTKNVKLVSSKKGETTFRGFFGKYQLLVTKPDGSQQTIDVHLREKPDNQWTFTL